MILGVDVWAGYGRIDWTAVARAGVRFVYVKCTEGNEPARDDRRYRENVEGARAAGLYVGAYHFAYPLEDVPGKPGRSPEEQAQRAFDACEGLGSREGELPPALDAEWPEVGSWGKWDVNAATLSRWLRRYVDEAERLWGRTPVLYTYPFWWRTLAASADVSWARRCPLWVASYKDVGEWLPRPTTSPHVLAPWDGDWTLWQFSADGSPVSIPGVPACPVDRNACRDLDTLRRLAGIDPDAITQPEIAAPLADTGETVLVEVPTMPSRRPPRVEDFAIVHPDIPLDRPELDED